jgi:hypothetical protein
MVAIKIPRGYIPKVNGDIAKANTPLTDRFDRRQISNAPVDTASVSPPKLTTQMLELTPETPNYNEDTHSPYQQLAGSSALCAFLSLGLPEIQKAAQEFQAEKAMGV